MKNIKYQTVSTISKYNQNNLETEAKSIPVIDIYIATHFLACFVDRCLKHKYYNPFLGLYFCPFYFGLCIVCSPSIYHF